MVGIPSALSFGVWSDITIFGKNIFDAVDFLSSNILMPLGALFISIFVSFKMEKKVLEAEFFVGGNYGKKVFTYWAFTSICSTTCNNYRLLKCNRNYLILNVIIFSKKRGDDHKEKFDRSREIYEY